MVNSISQAIQSIVDNDLSLQDALQRGYGNYSAIARMIKPKVEDILERRVKLESLITSVKRSKVNYRLLQGSVVKIIAESTISLRTDVAKISVEKTKRNLGIMRKALADLGEAFLQVLEGASAVTLIFDQRLFNKVYPLFGGEVLDKKQNLAAIIVHSPKEIIETPGCAIAFYRPLARSSVNIEETVSCFMDTIIVLPMEEVGKAFTALTEMIVGARKQLT
ncbi:unnamed protein product [marine sediment metagenome]|uniref:ACT domain-containing protein n=1 Tax=marine sediment metagenome TaxID=412755 RepID=X1D0F6_9ZZZZ